MQQRSWVQRVGGAAALTVAACFGLNLYAYALMERAGIHWSASVDPAVMLPYLAQRPFAFELYGLAYVGVDLARLALVLALYERFRGPAPAAARIFAWLGISEFIAFAVVNGFLRDALFGLADGYANDPAGAAITFRTVFVVLAALEWVGAVGELLWLAGIAALGILFRGFPRPFAYALAGYVALKALERVGVSFIPLYPWGTIVLYAAFGVTLLSSSWPAGGSTRERGPGGGDGA